MATHLKEPGLPQADVDPEVRATVTRVLEAVRDEGEAALRRYSREFDGWDPPAFRVGDAEIASAEEQVSYELKRHIAVAQDQVRRFAELQLRTLVDFEEEVSPGVVLGQKQIPVDSVGSYSPGGRYPMLASSIMTIVVPKVAGVRRVVAAAPPLRGGAGIQPAQLYAMASSGADEIYCVGGIQALAALAFGAGVLEPVDLVVGAGNAYVAEAKRQIFGHVGIDLLAGPTEILVIADGTADPELVAADLLGQAEHGPTSPAILVTTSGELGTSVLRKVERLLRTWPTAEITGLAWQNRGEVIVCADDAEMVAVSDARAPEHLELFTRDPQWFLERLRNYGSLFVGPQATVAFGDKGVGTNHVLPTGRAARYTGGLWVGKFLKTVTWQRLDDRGIRSLGPTIVAICEAEGMLGHAETVRLRLERIAGAQE